VTSAVPGAVAVNVCQPLALTLSLVSMIHAVAWPAVRIGLGVRLPSQAE
jgi:hypothetical protein